MDTEKAISTKQVMKILGLHSHQAIHYRLKRGLIPKPQHMDSHPFWNRDEIELIALTPIKSGRPKKFKVIS